jgi:acetyl esterase/lipase
LQDAQRAMSVVRSRASEWGIDPGRIGLLGFSAGGSLAARAATGFGNRAYQAVDDADAVSCRPDFCILIYPAYLTGKEGTSLRGDLPVSAETPPMFLAHANDDRVSPENSAEMYLALKRAGVPAELHVYVSGGHGFGLRPTGRPSASWPARCEEWMRSRGIVGATVGDGRP